MEETILGETTGRYWNRQEETKRDSQLEEETDRKRRPEDKTEETKLTGFKRQPED